MVKALLARETLDYQIVETGDTAGCAMRTDDSVLEGPFVPDELAGPARRPDPAAQLRGGGRLRPDDPRMVLSPDRQHLHVRRLQSVAGRSPLQALLAHACLVTRSTAGRATCVGGLVAVVEALVTVAASVGGGVSPKTIGGGCGDVRGFRSRS